jgi:hypothetical protein
MGNYADLVRSIGVGGPALVLWTSIIVVSIYKGGNDVLEGCRWSLFYGTWIALAVVQTAAQVFLLLKGLDRPKQNEPEHGPRIDPGSDSA